MPKVLDDFVRQSIDELLKAFLPAEELRKRLSPEERLKGLSAEEIAKALSPEVLEALARLKANDPGSKDPGKTGQP